MTNADAARLHLTIDGRQVAVEAGTTVAAALAIAGVGGTRTSVRGETRAALCGMGVCQECRVTIDGRAHVMACQTLCCEGQVVRTTVAANVINANANANANAGTGTVIATAAAAIKGTGTTTGTR